MDWHALLQHSHWHLILWAVVGALFLFTEVFAAIKGRKYATFTYIVKRGIPRWLAYVIAAALIWHFFIQS